MESTPALIAIAVACLGSGGVITIIITSIVGKGGRRADEAQKLIDTGGKIIERLEHELEDFDELKERCRRCEAQQYVNERRLVQAEARDRDKGDEIRELKGVMRLVVRVMDTGDQAAKDAAIERMKELI